MKKVIKLTESQFKKLLEKQINEQVQDDPSHYMFTENLKQIHWQTKKLLGIPSEMIDQLIDEDHDWMSDHLAKATESIDQVFHFLMKRSHENEPEDVPVKAKMGQFSLNEEEKIDEAKHKPTNPKLWAQCLAWAKSKYKVCPSAYCNGAAAKRYKSHGGGWKTVKK
jgi:hypothetical protein